MKEKSKRKINFKVIAYSVIAFAFVMLSFLVDWLFIIGAVLMVWLNSRELMKSKK